MVAGSEGDVVPADPAGRIAARQRGVVARWQLREAGLGERAIEYRVEVGRLHRIHRGVYAVGHSHLPRLGIETAALLACGSRSVLSHRTAAAFWGMGEELPKVVEVTVSGRTRRPRAGVRIHRTIELSRKDVRVRDGLPITAPERTMLDLAAVLAPRELAAAFDAARATRILREPQLLPLIARFPARRGTRALRALLATPGFSRSEAERRMLALIERAGLPRPKRNERVAGYEVDLLWPALRLVVEFDSYAHHSDREAFERDRRRDADLLAAGQRVIRVTWRQLIDEPEGVAVRLARVM